MLFMIIFSFLSMISQDWKKKKGTNIFISYMSKVLQMTGNYTF